jgi:hypothetical protein
MANSLDSLNPRVVTKQIGIRKLYTVNVYPLSFGDELTLLDMFSTALMGFLSLSKEDQTDMALAQAATDFIKNNISKVIKLVIDEDEWSTVSESKDLMKCFDNVQLLDLVQTIYDMNFGDEVQKKAKEMATNLVELMKTKKIEIQPSPPLN